MAENSFSHKTRVEAPVLLTCTVGGGGFQVDLKAVRVLNEHYIDPHQRNVIYELK